MIKIHFYKFTFPELTLFSFFSFYVFLLVTP